VRQRALALADVAIAIGVSAILLAAAAHGSGVLESGRTSRVIDDIQQLRDATAVWAHTGNRTSYAGISIGALNAANVLPRSSLLTPWGGTLELVPRAADSYWVVIGGVPASARDSIVRQYQTQILAENWDGTTLWLAFQ
jgi:hypothetical protein